MIGTSLPEDIGVGKIDLKKSKIATVHLLQARQRIR
jgi:hypothetical protein